MTNFKDMGYDVEYCRKSAIMVMTIFEGDSNMGRYETERSFLKSNFNLFKSIKTERNAQPEGIKSYDPEAVIINLPQVDEAILKKANIYECIKDRRSIRRYSEEAITLEELSYLLWSTQGISGSTKAGLTLKTVPCSGATKDIKGHMLNEIY